MLGAPPLCAPARVIPGRTLFGVKVGVAPIPSLNFKLGRLDVTGGCAEVPVSVLLQRRIERGDGLGLTMAPLERIRVLPVTSDQQIHHLPLDLNLLEQQQCSAFGRGQIADGSDFPPNNLCIKGASQLLIHRRMRRAEHGRSARCWQRAPTIGCNAKARCSASLPIKNPGRSRGLFSHEQG